MILDTNILVRFQREELRGEPGDATRFLQALPPTRLCITPVIAGEFACGKSMAKQEQWQEFLSPFEMLPFTQYTAWHYGCIYRDLASSGQLIGSNDIWISAAALAHKLPVATGNTREFQRIKNLDVIPV